MRFDITQYSQLDNCILQLQTRFTSGVIYLNGDLGTGKTTFVSRWLALLGYRDVVTSPTYTLVNIYQIGTTHIFHADLYRLMEPEELIYLDVAEWVDRATLIFVEWAERGIGYLPYPDLQINFMLNKDKRTITTDEQSLG